LYQASGRSPAHSINFITCHDGFTLNDLVSYEQKHNLANGENNRDGSDANYSWNCGVEGLTDDPRIVRLRRRQAKNLIATLFLSQGVPMLLAGDEFLRTQRGNNNAWCQDNEVSWVDWTLAETNKDFLRFVREMILLRKRHPALRRRDFLRGAAPPGSSVGPDIAWHGNEPNKPDFSAKSRAIAFALDGQKTGREPGKDIYVAINGARKPAEFVISQSPSGAKWRRVVDTSLPSPQDIVAEDEGVVVAFGGTYPLPALSLAIFITT
jgi:glycogen operon protein